MGIPTLTRDQVRRIDQIAIEQYGVPGIVLMENAGRGAAEAIADFAMERETTFILCGSGNNAGDGYVIARHLELMGFPCRIFSLVDPSSLRGDAATNAEIARRAEIAIDHVTDVGQIENTLRDAATIVECLLGTGATGAPRGIYADVIRAANESDGLCAAIDIPAGLDCDTGQAHDPTLEADFTISMVAHKAGIQAALARPYVGQTYCVDIGAPKKLLQEFLGDQWHLEDREDR